MKLYDDNDLMLFKQKAPFFTHPYEHWCKDKSLQPAVRSLEKMVDKLLDEENFKVRLSEARKQVNDPLNFYTFITEIIAADFLKRKSKENFEILKSKLAMPDFKADGIYVEVNMLHKNFIIMKRLEEELKSIDSRFCFERRHWNPVKLPDLQRAKNIYDEIADILNPSAGDIKPTIVWQSDDINNPLIGVLNDSEANYMPGHNQQSCPQPTIFVYLKESLNSKIKKDKNGLVKELTEETEDGKNSYVMKNDLNNRHPNILWSEFMFLEDFQSGSAVESFNLGTIWFA